MKILSLLLFLFFSFAAQAQSPWYFGSGEAVNLTNGIKYSNGVKNITGALDPSSVAVNAPAGSIYERTDGTVYIKQDAGSTTNWTSLASTVDVADALVPIDLRLDAEELISIDHETRIDAAEASLPLKAPLASPALTGTPTAPTASAGTNSTQVATTAYADAAVTTGTAGKQNTLVNSAGLAAALSDETGTGLAVFGTSPNITTPTGIVKGDVGLGNVDNTSDANKPVSTATQTALNLKADLASPALTGNPTAPTQTAGNNSTRVATTAYADGAVSTLSGTTTSALALKANLASPSLTGTPTAPTPTANDGSTKISTTAYVDNAVGNVSVAGKGQADAGTIALRQLQLPNHQLTQTDTNSLLIETNSTNLLANPSFEGSALGSSWVTTGATPVLLAGVGIHGTQSLSFTTSSNTFTLVQDSTINAADFGGSVQGILSVRLKTTHTGDITICPRIAGVVTTDCITVTAASNGGKWALYRIPFMLGATSNGISISAATGTGVTNIEDAFVGIAADFDTVPSGTITKDCTITGSWSTNTTYTCKKWQVGTNMHYRFKVATSGAPTSAALYVNLPTGDVIDTVALLSTVARADILGDAKGVDLSTEYYDLKVGYRDTTSVNILFQTTNGATKIVTSTDVTQAAPFTLGSGDYISVHDIVLPLVGLSSTINTYSGQCQTDADCENDFVARISATGVKSGDDLGFLTAGPFTPTGTSIFAITFTTSLFSVAPVCTAQIDQNNIGYMVKNSVETTSGVSFTVYNSTPANAAFAFTLKCSRAGSDRKPRRQIVGSFQYTPKTIGTSGSDFQRVYFGSSADCSTQCTTGTCTICSQIGNKITSVTWQATGAYNINGLDATKYTCNGSSLGTGSTFIPLVNIRHDGTSSYVRILNSDNARAATITCSGVP